MHDTEPVSLRHNSFARVFCNSDDCINDLLPSEQPIEIISGLRRASIICRTDQYTLHRLFRIRIKQLSIIL